MTVADPGPSTPHPQTSDITSRTATCAHCSSASKYTCPRCDTKTCSLACSKFHKTSTGCTGQRDKAAYVPMNSYGWGTLADDYTYLEDVGRSVSGWGREIRGLGKGRNKGKGRGPALSLKCENLRVQLAARDIEVRFLAEGMEKRRLSQSSWDPRTKTVYLTVEFIFHIRQDNKPTTVSILTHRNDLSSSLISSLTAHLKHKSDVPTSVLDLMGGSRSEPSEGSSPPSALFTFSQLEKPAPGAVPTKYQAPALHIRVGPSQPSAPAPSMPQQPKPRRVFYPLDSTASFQTLLRHRSFIEWPTIEVFASRAAFQAARVGDLAEGGAEGTALATIEKDTGAMPAPKRRRTETGLVQLVGGYGEESNSDTELSHGVIGGLGDYGSDEEELDEGLGESIGSESS